MTRRAISWNLVLGLVLAACAACAVGYLARALELSRWVVHTALARDDAGVVLETALEEEVGALGYLIAARPEHLATYEDGARRLMGAIDVFRGRTSDNPRQQILAGRLETEARELGLILARSVLLATTDDPGARAAFHVSGAKARMDSIRRLIVRARAEEDQLLAHRIAAAEADFARIGVIGWFASVLMVGAIVPIIVRVLSHRGEAAP